MSRLRCAFALLGVLGLSSAAARADDLEKVEKEIVGKWEQRKSLSAKLTMKMNMEVKGQRMRSEGAGTYEMLRRGSKVLVRQELNAQMLLNANGQEMKINQASLVIGDGEFDYTINETLGNKQVFKGRPKKSLEFEPTQMFKYMREQSELKLLPEEKLEGEDVYVVETRPKKPTPNAPIARSLYYFSKETGAPLRMVSKNDKDEDVQIMQFSALEFDARIDPDRFKFEAPEGVKVIDQTSAP